MSARTNNRNDFSTLTTFKRTGAMALLALTIAAGSALALDGEDPMKGPEVPVRTAPGGSGTFGNEKSELARRTEVQVPHMAFIRMLREVTGPDAPEALRATEDQKAQVERISKEFTDAQRGFMEKHRDELRELAQRHPEIGRMLREHGFGPEGGRGGRPQRTDRTGAPRGDRPQPGEGGKRGPVGPGGPEGDPMMGPGGEGRGEGMGGEGGKRPEPLDEKSRAEVMQRLQALRADAPKAEDARTAIWAVLRPEQQAAVQTKVDAFKAERLAQRDEQYKERQKREIEGRFNKQDGQGKDGAKPGPGGPGGPGGARGEAPKLSDAQKAEVLASLPAEAQEKINQLPAEMQARVLGRLSQLPAEKRAEALERMRERLRGGQPKK